MRSSDGEFAAEFIEGHCRITAGDRTGELVQLLDFQRALLDDLLALDSDGRRRHRQALIMLPRKNGKTYLLACLCLYEAVIGEPGGEIYFVAGDRMQASRALRECKRIIEMDAELSSIFRSYRYHIEVPSTGTIMRVLSSDAGLQQGLSPSFVCFDEVSNQANGDLWNALTLGSGARSQPLTVGISTPGFSKDSLLYRLYDYGTRIGKKEIEDSTFFFRAWEPSDPECDHRDPSVWRQTHPALGVFLFEEDFESTVKKTPEHDFRRFRLGQWTTTSQAALPYGAWDACADSDREIPVGARVTLGFDGSYSRDATALVGATVEQTPHLFVIDTWEQPPADPGWRVNVSDVRQAILDACVRYVVLECVMDSYRWQETMAQLEDEGVNVIDFPTYSVSRMVKTWQRFSDAVHEKHLTHDGDPRLARHVANLILKTDRIGTRPTRDRNSPRSYIDAAVAAVIAHEQATVIASRYERRTA